MKAGGAVAAAVKAEMALVFSTARSGFPLLLATTSLISPLSSASELLPPSARSPALLPALGFSLTRHEVSGDAMRDASVPASSQDWHRMTWGFFGPWAQPGQVWLVIKH